MRGLILLVIIIASIPVALLKPYVGIYLWYWIGLMNPHRFTWGFSFPLAQAVGLATLIGSLFVRRRAPLLRSPEIMILLAFTALFTMTTILALFPDLARPEWEKVMKTLLMTYMTVILIEQRAKLRVLLIVVVLSVGFIAVKGSICGMATGGQYRLWGPEGSTLADNNSLGLALNMTLPLALFLARTEERKWTKWLFYGVSLSSLFGIILTYSRGALVGLIPVSAMLLYRARRNVLLVVLLIVVSLGILAFIPGQWFERMGTIKTYEQDESAMLRIQTWQFAWELALQHPLTGGGFEGFRANPTNRNPHSIYFGMLGEQGFVAFGLFVVLLLMCFRNLGKLEKRAARWPELKWYTELAPMLRVSLVGYAASGTFLNLQYFDLFYLIVALVAIMRNLMRAEITALTLSAQAEAQALESPEEEAFEPPQGANPARARGPRSGM